MLDMFKELGWLKDHYIDIGGILAALICVAEMIVRMTPTKDDDGAVERIGAKIRRVFDMLGVPNRKCEPPKE